MLKNAGKSLAGYSALAYFVLTFTVIPFYYENAYFNISAAKGHAYASAATLVLCMIAVFAAMIHDKTLLPPRNQIVLSFLALGAVSVMSCVCSGDIKKSFLGLDGWGVGTLAVVSFGLFLTLMVKYLRYSQNLWLIALLSNAAIFIMVMLHSVGVDVLGLHKGIDPGQYYMYVSTIGNVNWFVGYLCLIVSAAAMFYLSCTERISSYIYLAFLALGIPCFVLCASDGIFLGLGVCAFFAVPYIASNPLRLKRVCVLIGIYGLALIIVSHLPMFAGKKASMNGLVQVLLNGPVPLAITSVGVGGYIVFTLTESRWTEKHSRIFVWSVEILLSAAAIYYVLDMIINFSDQWGTNRGLIWRHSMEVFADLPFEKKIFGIGPGMTRSYYRNLSQEFGKTVLASHSEPIQYLLTTGVLGAVCWLSAWIGIIRKYFTGKLWQKNEVALFVPLTAYLGQSLVNSPSITNVAVLCVILACFLIVESEGTSDYAISAAGRLIASQNNDCQKKSRR